MKIEINKIKLDEEIYPRSRFDWVTSYKYSQAMVAGAKFPPITVGLVKNKYVLVDGYHRLEAYKKLKKVKVEANVLSGRTKKQLFIEAVRLNAQHGYQFNSQDTTNIVLKLKKYNISKQKIASIVGIPITKLDKYMVSRTATISIGGKMKDVFLKRPFRHYAGEVIPASYDEEQEIFVGSHQLHLLEQVIILVEDKHLNLDDKKVVERVSKLYGLLGGLMKK